CIGITEQEGRPLRRSSISSLVTSAVKFLDVGMLHKTSQVFVPISDFTSDGKKVLCPFEGCSKYFSMLTVGWIITHYHFITWQAFLLSPYTIQFPLNSFSEMEIKEELTSLLPALDREKIICIVEHLMDVIGAEDLKPFLTPIQIRKLLLAFKGAFPIPENLNDTITLELCPAASAEASSHPPHPSSSTSWVSHLQIPWDRRIHCRNPKRASCEEVAQIIVNRYPQTFADFTEKGERLGCGHYSLLRSIKSRVEHVNRDNTTHRLRQTKRTRNEEDCSPNSNATPPKKVRCLVDSYGCINWQPVELPEGETPASLEEKKHILFTIFNSQGPGAVERPDLINSCLSPSVAEIQEQWPFLFTGKGLSNHFYKLTGIDISERLGQALITKGRRIINYFSSQKLKWKLGISTLIQQIESEGVLTNNKVGTAAILLMVKYDKEDEDSLFVLADETSTRMSLEAKSNLPITPRLIMLGQNLMTATCWMVSTEGRVIVELDKENTFADAMSVFFGSFYVLNLEYQGTKCTSNVGTSRKTGTTVKRKVVHINPHVTTFLQRLTEFEWKTSN
uniref:Zgc:113210 n=1 Tax=Neolamprologus brichardi TaxID=32507 RepID=A0A3Q4H1Y4_NEOBR